MGCDPTGHWTEWANWFEKNIIYPLDNFFSPQTNSIGGQFQSEIFRGSGSATFGYSESNSRFQINYKGNVGKGFLGLYEKISIGNANGKIGVGNNDIAFYLKGVVDAITVNAQSGILCTDGLGVAAIAKASVLSGRATTSLEVFGREIEFGISGDFLSIGAEAMYVYFPEHGFTAKGSIGVGLFGAGILFRVKLN